MHDWEEFKNKLGAYQVATSELAKAADALFRTVMRADDVATWDDPPYKWLLESVQLWERRVKEAGEAIDTREEE